MKQNILIIILSATFFYILWIFGLENIYAHILQFGVNVFYIFWSDIHAEVQEMAGKLNFVLYYDKTGWREPMETIGMPLVLLLTWQVLLMFHFPLKKAAKLALRNIGIFILAQVFYMMLLYGMNSSAFVVFIFRLLKNSFGIVVLFMIIWDIYSLNFSFRNKPVFNKKSINDD